MDHDFQPSLTDDKKCVTCKRVWKDHTKLAQCEACPKVGVCELFCDMLLCADCYKAEMAANQKALEENNTPDKQEARVIAAHETSKLAALLDNATKIDQSIQLDTQIFNAKTVALIEIMNAINEDPSVENKPYARAEFAVTRIRHLTQVIFEQKKALTEAENEQRAIQVYLNQIANQLREEERAKLKIADIQYQPATPKQAKPKSNGATKKTSSKPKVDMTEVNKWATKIGMPGTLVHMRMLSKNMTAEQAARTFAAENNITVKED